MLSINLKRSAVTLGVVTGLLAAAGPASAIVYNGHAGIGSSAYQHNQTDHDYVKTTSANGIATDGIGAWIP